MTTGIRPPSCRVACAAFFATGNTELAGLFEVLGTAEAVASRCRLLARDQARIHAACDKLEARM